MEKLNSAHLNGKAIHWLGIGGGKPVILIPGTYTDFMVRNEAWVIYPLYPKKT